MSSFSEKLFEFFIKMVSGFDSNVEGAVDILTRNIFSGSLYNMATAVKDAITPIALTIISICFLIEVLNITAKFDILKREYMAKVFIKLVFAKVIIEVAPDLMEVMYLTASEWINGISVTNGTLAMTVETALQDQFDTLSWQDGLALISTMALPLFAVWVSGLIVKVIAYARMFELLIYIAVSPLPCAFMPAENSRITKKFFLAFSGVCLQGVFILISIKIYQALCADVLVDAVSSADNIPDICMNVLLGSLVLVMAVVKSGSWSKTIMDAI